MLNTDNRKYIPEVDRCMQEARRIMGHLPPSTALFTIIAAMTLGFADSHSEEAVVDFHHRFADLAEKYPIHVSPADKNQRLNVNRAMQLRSAWNNLRPRVHTRAVQIVEYSTACLMMQFLHGSQARADFEQMTREWAERWESERLPDPTIKDASFDDPIPDDVEDIDLDNPTKLVEPKRDDPIAGTGARDEEVN